MRRAITGASIAGLLASMLLQSWPAAAVSLLVWLWVLLRWHRPVLKRIYRPRLWLFSIFVALASGLLLGQPGSRDLWLGLSWPGLMAGLWMVMRCLALLSLASYMASNLGRGPLLAWLAQHGMGNLASHVRVAVETLPAAQDRLVETWRRFRTGHRKVTELPGVLHACYFALVMDATTLPLTAQGQTWTLTRAAEASGSRAGQFSGSSASNAFEPTKPDVHSAMLPENR